jgi:hypothetical protein
VLPNPDLPQFPVGTQLAFVRQMALIDHEGNFTPTRITEQVQLRVHRAISTTIPEGVNLDSHSERTSQDFFEFKLSKAKLLAGDPSGLHAVTRDEKEFPLFMSHGIDVFEHLQERNPVEQLRTTLNFCVSANSLSRWTRTQSSVHRGERTPVLGRPRQNSDRDVR